LHYNLICRHLFNNIRKEKKRNLNAKRSIFTQQEQSSKRVFASRFETNK
jgi:hypothetical protein